MLKARTFLFIGIWVAVLPYLGFPYFWKDILSTLTGITIIILSYGIYREHKLKEGKEKQFDNFRENNFEKKERPPLEEMTPREAETFEEVAN